MSGDAHKAGAEALKSLLSMAFSALGEKEYAAAAGLLTKKLMISAGQTVEVMRALRDAVGKDIFEAQLKSLTAHQARLLARRLDKSVPDIEVSTAGAACAWIRDLMDGKTPEAAPVVEAPTEEPAAETPEETEAETPAEPEAPKKPASSGAYFGRKSFRTGN
ncbi:hypothetical protein [Hyphomonas sp.]|uniref:hypothetical protein n=1 Tax=Hyphomonas sp. TaxID=87 RepID=UPI000C559E10|nr:hypothetical protein [Hyphomonas sp.]MAB10710.1 hypothetical protein [Hyphomonas sp.]MBM56861.1 hypothetical protein [Hyphomonas sp.]